VMVKVLVLVEFRSGGGSGGSSIGSSGSSHSSE
jgi:hypothetical protein